jgi:predicted N-acetyltransferase YhbS
MWVPPGGNLLGPDLVSGRYDEMVASLPEPAPGRVAAADEAVDALMPSASHWYLGVLACHPARRGEHLGSDVLVPVLAAADRAGLPVALETASSRNVAYYTRRGFAVAAHASIEADGDPPLDVWVMQREPLDRSSAVTGGLAADAGS